MVHSMTARNWWCDYLLIDHLPQQDHSLVQQDLAILPMKKPSPLPKGHSLGKSTREPDSTGDYTFLDTNSDSPLRWR